jgi:regulator of RNase E activity RraA
VVVVQDLDPEPSGAMFGEVQGRVHRAIGAVGLVTNGAVRDVTELTAIGFPVLGGAIRVSHGYPHFVEVDVPVTVAGLEVRPGDLLHGDRHGVQLIPADVDLEELGRVARELDALEVRLFAGADAATDLPSFLATWDVVMADWPTVQAGRRGAV